ncbi:MAG TPA: CocE/NonD family hydrolase [Fimbriimonadaceae bacterium]|nr:CocE/NonD family hydrolase [Fimbriimonadaceae bacterium]
MLLALAALSGAETTQSTDILIGGQKVGQSVWVERPDGSFKSDMSLSVQGVSIESHLTGTIKEGKLIECDLTEASGANKGHLIWKDGKLTAFRNDKEQFKDKELPYADKPFMSSFHLQMWKTLWNALAKPGASNEVELVDLSSFSTFKAKFTRRDVTVQLGSGPKKIAILSTTAEGIGLDLAFDEDGNPLGMNVPVQSAQFILEGYEGVFVDPLSKYPELSQPTFKVKEMNGVDAPMRDGVKLVADIAVPESQGKYPTILIRTPYGRAVSMLTAEWYAKRGYAVMCQDVRGRGDSDGEWDPLVNERKDGKDTIDWITEQTWSDGKVGMIGGSYLGYVQWAAATSGDPALKCIVPQVSPPPPVDNFPWDHGAFMLLPDIWWCRVVKDKNSDVQGAFANLGNLDAMKTLPIGKVDDAYFGETIPFFDRWISRGTLASWGDVFTLADVAKVKIPVLSVSGVWDGDGVGTMEHWAALRAAKGTQWVVFGPWSHLFDTFSKYGDVDYGPDAVMELDSTYLRFFDTYLKGKSVSFDKVPRVQFFVTGANKWVDGPDWPLPSAKPVTYYLGGGKASGADPQGTLTSKIGTGKDSYVYDPNHVAFDEKEVHVDPTGSSTVFPKEAIGQGTLVYRTSPFDSATTLAGPMNVELYITTSAKDATFHVQVLDQDADGTYRMIALLGTARATYHDGKFSPLVPGKAYKVTVEPWWFAHEFEKGHRLAILVFSDSFPQFARNPGTGEPDWEATKLVRAVHSVWKDKVHPSHITLWRIPNPSN